MPQSRITTVSKGRLAWLSSMPAFEFELGERREAPSEFRLFRAGPNETDKGTFLFDDEAARLVMEAWAADGKTLMGDYEHQSLSDPPQEAPASASEWTPEARNGELWATKITWTDRARGYLEAGEYRFFSPAFKHDPETGRILRLINFALTNNPATHQLEPLVAATSRGDSDMACTECAALAARLTAMEEECKALTAKLSAFEKKDDDAEKKEGEEKEKLTALRSQILSITGKGSDAEAIGVVTALKAAHGELAALKAKLAEETTARLTAEFKTVLDGACKDGKVQPSQRAFWEAQAQKLGVSEGVAMLKSFVETASPVVATAAASTGTEERKLSALGSQLATNMGINAAAFAKFQATGKLG
jgi:phage I-like protein